MTAHGIAIRVEGLSKRYRIGELPARYDTLRDRLAHLVAAPLRRVRDRWSGRVSANAKPTDVIWALEDVSFEVERGEVIGVIGRNGAGKTTLLRILSRITEPTTGIVEIRGRVGSLLEVGTGFHPELTGRENIYLNGAILGMKRAEIARRFDEMVAFAEIERFLDTPVKRYSSGMYVRLAFAVAAHLEPEVLLVDEVLAVGDAGFQRKCLGKIGDVARDGRTVIFVSHNMHAVATLCRTTMRLEQGVLVDRGPASMVISDYLAARLDGHAEARWSDGEGPGSEGVRLTAVWVHNGDARPTYDHPCKAPIAVSMEFRLGRRRRVVPSIHVYNETGILVFTTTDVAFSGPPECDGPEPGMYRCDCLIPSQLLNTGRYSIHAFVSRDTDGHAYAHVPDAISFQVLEDGTGRGHYLGFHYPGVIRPVLRWSRERVGHVPTSLDAVTPLRA